MRLGENRREIWRMIRRTNILGGARHSVRTAYMSTLFAVINYPNCLVTIDYGVHGLLLPFVCFTVILPLLARVHALYGVRGHGRAFLRRRHVAGFNDFRVISCLS